MPTPPSPSAAMQPSRVNTVTIPAIGSNATQAGVPPLFVANTKPMRVLVRNVGATLIFLAHSPNEVQNTPATSGVFQLPTGVSEAFVLAPRQGLYAVAQGAGGSVSYAASEAVPFHAES